MARRALLIACVVLALHNRPATQRVASTPLRTHPSPSPPALHAPFVSPRVGQTTAQLAAQALSTDAVPIKVQLIAPPLYVMTTTCVDKAAGVDALTAAIAAAKAEIEKRGGQLAVKKAPLVTSSREDSELQRMLADLEAANAEVSGDEDSDEDDDASDSESDGDEGGKSAAKSVLADLDADAGAAKKGKADAAAAGAGAAT